MRANIKELHITVGLPASGKTKLFKELYDDNRRNQGRVTLIECDNYLERSRYNNSMSELLKDRASTCSTTTYLDGLFLTKNDIVNILNILKGRDVAIERVIIHYWNPDTDKCQWNDMGRREKNSTITIVNAKIDSIKDIMKIKDEFEDIKFGKQTYNIVMKEAWKVFSDMNELYADENGITTGDSWSMGGSWADCWENTGSVSPETPPDGVRLLDDLLEKLVPTISFLQYKKITNTCVEIDEYSEGDYYGGSVYYNKQLINIKSLYEYLVENELIDNLEL